ncbi:MAG: hypothetical protein RM368_31505, partial [Nostoc sp. DedSLP03]|uniref:hypothetical protein n=1 Tax=Nostoc sp. DedSLP03 TaxID=3075400 RepID=UPI002AD361B6
MPAAGYAYAFVILASAIMISAMPGLGYSNAFIDFEYPITISEYPITISEYPITISEYPIAISEYPITISEYPITISE